MSIHGLSDPPARKKLAEYALEYHVSLRTVKRWKKAGFPLDQPMELLRILGTRMNVPKGLRAILGRLGDKTKPASTLERSVAIETWCKVIGAPLNRPSPEMPESSNASKAILDETKKFDSTTGEPGESPIGLTQR